MRKLLALLTVAALALVAGACGTKSEADTGNAAVDGAVATMSADDHEAQAALKDALAAAKVHYTDHSSFAAATPEALTPIEPGVVFAPLLGAGVGVVGGGGIDDLSVLFVTQSKSGTWFCIAMSATGQTYGESADVTAVNSLALCNGPQWPSWVEPDGPNLCLAEEQNHTIEPGQPLQQYEECDESEG